MRTHPYSDTLTIFAARRALASMHPRRRGCTRTGEILP